MSTALTTFINDQIDNIALSVGYDSTDLESKAVLRNFIESAIEDMMSAGISEQIVIGRKLSFITICLYVKDNIVLAPGTSQTSSIYVANVQKLRMITRVEATKEATGTSS